MAISNQPAVDGVSVIPTLARACAWLLAAASLAACAPASRMMRDARQDAGIPVDASASVPGQLSVQVERALVRNAPGSWVRDARWDEYRLVVRNDSEAPLQLLGASLESARLPPAPGTADLDQLERASSKQMRALKSAGVVLSVGYLAGGLAMYGTAAGASQVSLLAAASAAAVLMPVGMIAGGVYMHRKHKREREDRVLIQAGIEQRGLAMDTPMASGEGRAGSFFFPITPAPLRLVLQYGVGDSRATLAVELPSLENLHLKPRK